MAKQQIPGTLDLVRGNVVLGTIEVSKGDADSPWYNGVFSATAEFQAVQGLFDRELKLLRANTSDNASQWDDWEAVHEELHEPGLRLEARETGYRADEILIHISGTEAWWRNDQGLDS